MVFAVKKHVKGAESMDDLKKFFIYSMERVDRWVQHFAETFCDSSVGCRQFSCYTQMALKKLICLKGK